MKLYQIVANFQLFVVEFVLKSVSVKAHVQWGKRETQFALVAAIISLAHALKLKVVAEGVETKEELEILRKHHCEFVQGFYFSKPLCVNEFSKVLKGYYS